jgi:hypothetical protein
MNEVIMWRAVGQNDLSFVRRCSVLVALFCEDGPDTLFEYMNLYEGQLLDGAQFRRVIGA